QHAAGLERRMELPQHPGQLGGRDMEERGVGKDAVEALGRQLEREEILFDDLAAAVFARHPGETRRAFEPDRLVAEFGEGLQVAPGTAAEIEDSQGWLALQVA